MKRLLIIVIVVLFATPANAGLFRNRGRIARAVFSRLRPRARVTRTVVTPPVTIERGASCVGGQCRVPFSWRIEGD